MTSDFLGPDTEIFVFALIFYPRFPESFQCVSVSLEASWSRAPLYFDSELVLDTALPDTEATICFSTTKSDTFYSLLRIRCADH